MEPCEGCLPRVSSACHILVFSFTSLCCFMPELSLESKMREIRRLPEPQGSMKRGWELYSCCSSSAFWPGSAFWSIFVRTPVFWILQRGSPDASKWGQWTSFSLHWAVSILPAARLWRPRVEVDPGSTYILVGDTASAKGIISEVAFVSRAWPKRWHLKTIQAS